MTATEILKKHKVVPNKNARAKIAVEQAVKDRANRRPGVDPAGEGAVQKAVAKDKIAQEKTSKFVESLHPIKSGSRADLIKQAKEKGIKYFRILNKEELETILAGTTPETQSQIIEKAKARWKAGWGSKAQEATQ